MKYKVQVSEEALADLAKWMQEKFEEGDLPRDPVHGAQMTVEDAQDFIEEVMTRACAVEGLDLDPQSVDIQDAASWLQDAFDDGPLFWEPEDGETFTDGDACGFITEVTLNDLLNEGYELSAEDISFVEIEED